MLLLERNSCSGLLVSEESALEMARRLPVPPADALRGGEFEALEFWEKNEDLLERARLELGPLHSYVYAPSPRQCFRDEVLDGTEKPQATSVPGVYSIRLLRDDFAADLLSELAHLRNSGIPMRRPNGMNRDGLILSFLGFQPFLETLASVVRPMGLGLYRHALRDEDVEELYGFSIRYQRDGDVKLAEHADASALTLNVCLGHEDFEGGDLIFRGVRFHDDDAETRIALSLPQQPGVALIHLGQHLHSAAPLLRGVRENVVLWTMGKHGTVRIAPYSPTDII